MLEPGLAEMHLRVDDAGHNVQPGSLDAHKNLGQTLADKGQFDDAIGEDAPIFRDPQSAKEMGYDMTANTKEV